MSFNRYMRAMSNGGLVMGQALTDDALRKAVPSIFATEAHESRSDKFVPVPTIEVLGGLRREGFDPFFAQQARTRVQGKAEYTRHILRMRHRSIASAEGEAFEIILINANDGTSSYQMIPGYFRFVCANGLMAGDTFNEIKVRHSGNAIDEVIEGAFTVLDDAEGLTEQVQGFKAITVSAAERGVLAEAAHQLRFPDAHKEDGKPAPVTAERLLTTRRRDDRASDLWTAFNVVQENTIRGGLAGRIRTGNGTTRRQRTRAVGGISQNKALNRALWTLTERMAALKAA